VRPINPDFKGYAFSYPTLVNNKLAQKAKPKYPLFETAFPMWDNAARKPGNGNTFACSSPELYKLWLSHICRKTKADPALPEPMVFVNAWNEWAEGAHLEPDRRYGYAYLKATREALTETSIEPSGKEVEPVAAPKDLERAVLLYDMGFVGAPESIPQGTVIHAHALAPPRLPETFKLDIGFWREAFAGARGLAEKASKLTVLTVVQEPVGRNVNAFLRLAHTFIKRLPERLQANDICVDELHEIFLEFLDQDVPARWFEEQFEPVLGIDVLSQPFERSRGYATYDQRLIVRRENLKSDPALLGQLLGIEGAMMADSPEDPDLRKLFQSKALPSPYVEEMYSSAYAKHFYTDEELAGFQWYWSSI